MTTSKVEETLTAIQGRKDYYLKKRQAVKDGTYDAEKDPESQPKRPPTSNGVASSSHSPAVNGDIAEDFEHVSMTLMVATDMTPTVAGIASELSPSWQRISWAWWLHCS